MTDERLLADYLSHRDGSVFEILVRRHGPMVYRVCRDILGDREHAEDAFQATFLVLLRRAESIREQGSLDRWLYGVASRISRRERRRLVRLRFQERQATGMESAATSDLEPPDRELKPILHEEIGRLPTKLRDAIVLCYFDGLSVDDAARRLSCPVGTLKSRLGKGRELLRDRLTRRGVASVVALLLILSLTEQASAAMPDSLLDETLKAGSRRLQGSGVSRRVASMVLDEEARNRWIRTGASWKLLIVLLLILGASWMTLGRKAAASSSSPWTSSSSSPGLGNVLSAYLPFASSLNPKLVPVKRCGDR